MRRLLAGVALAAVGCEAQDIYIEELYSDGGAPVRPAPDQGPPPAGEGRWDTPARIAAWLDGKTLTMAGDAIPSHPNGFDEDVNYGQATQCYHEVVIEPLEGRWVTRSQLGTLNGAPEVGDRGECDRGTPGGSLEFASTAVLIEDVRGGGECFDVTVTYPGFGQEGRARIAPDGRTVTMELFFKDQATGHRCADGPVGAPTVVLNGAPFEGDARQVYTVAE